MDNTQEIVAARRGKLLVIGIGEGENMIASDITAIISRTRKFIILDDNEVAIVRPDEVIVMNEFGDKVEKGSSDRQLGYVRSRKGRLSALHAQGDHGTA